MDMALNNGLCELSQDEMKAVDGGWNWGVVLSGAGLVVACMGITLATGGIGLCTVPLILGAGTSAEIAIAGTAVVGSAIGGAAIGYGATN